MQSGRLRWSCRRKGLKLAGVFALALAWAVGCDAFNPSFLNLFAGGGTAGDDVAFQTVSPPTGHVPVLFLNNARISDEVFTFMIRGDTVVRDEVVDELLRVNPQSTAEQIRNIVQGVIDNDPVDLESINLPPRVRLIVDITLVDGGVQRLEFLEGLRLLRGEDLLGGSANAADLPPDLTENTNSIFIVQCDIAQIQIVRIDVFIPVVIRDLTFNCINIGGTQLCCDGCTRDAPRFDALDFDANVDPISGTFQTLRNLDPRFFPPPLASSQCGTVVVLELEGNLTLPFERALTFCLPATNPPVDSRIPGFCELGIVGTSQMLQIPGRYQMNLRVRDE